jgi:hypothetical protein
MFSFPEVDTRDAAAVVGRIHELLSDIDPQGDLTLFDRVFEDVQLMFHGQFGDYRPIDLRYHDYQHTLQATLCMAEILAGRAKSQDTPQFTWRQVELGMAAILLHDSGYLKTAADGEGTGAKFTYTHVLRSAAVAASQLPRHGVHREEIDMVVNAIRCTGLTSDINRLPFHGETETLVGCCVSTSDYLAQMAADDYPDELEILYEEFTESDDYLGVPKASRMFSSPADLIRKTPGFWQHVVLPKLEQDYRGVYRYLADPSPDGPNPYLEAIERNMKIINKRITTLAPDEG